MRKLENAVIQTLQHYDINSEGKCDMPGVYVNDKKIASIGLRIKRGCSYHGLSLNVDMDLTPFTYINPCGYENLHMAQVKNYVSHPNMEEISEQLSVALLNELNS